MVLSSLSRMVATSGDALIEDDAVSAYREALFPMADLITPNMDEAAALLGRPVGDEAALPAAARTARHIVAAVQADGDETYFIMQSGRIAILRKVEIVLSRQVSSTVVALSGIHE